MFPVKSSRFKVFLFHSFASYKKTQSVGIWSDLFSLKKKKCVKKSSRQGAEPIKSRYETQPKYNSTDKKQQLVWIEIFSFSNSMSYLEHYFTNSLSLPTHTVFWDKQKIVTKSHITGQ